MHASVQLGFDLRPPHQALPLPCCHCCPANPLTSMVVRSEMLPTSTRWTCICGRQHSATDGDSEEHAALPLVCTRHTHRARASGAAGPRMHARPEAAGMRKQPQGRSLLLLVQRATRAANRAAPTLPSLSTKELYMSPAVSTCSAPQHASHTSAWQVPPAGGRCSQRLRARPRMLVPSRPPALLARTQQPGRPQPPNRTSNNASPASSQCTARCAGPLCRSKCCPPGPT